MLKTRVIPSASSAYQYPLLIKSILEQSVRYTPENEIIYRDLRRYNYLELQKRVARLANVLTQMGVKAGDTVAVMDCYSHRYLECFFAVPMIGAVLHTINVRLSVEQILYTINHAEDKVLLVYDEFLPLLEAIQPQINMVEKYLLLTDTPDKQPTTALPLVGEYENLLSQAAEVYEFADFDENSIATTFYTTGTTGNPKGVFFSHRQLVLHTLGIGFTVGCYETQGRFRSADVYMPITPMFHVHAWGVPYLATFLGVKQVYPGKYEPAMLLSLLLKEKVTFSHCVPTILNMLVSSPVAKQVDLSKWKVIIGGSALPKGLARAALELGIDVYTGYGMSETGPLATLTYLTPEMLAQTPEEQATYRTKTGIPTPLVSLKIVDEEGNTLPHDGRSVGEIMLRSPWLTQGYFKEEEKGEELWATGWLRTGDVAYIDEKGYVQITDRSKDVIKTGGEWISSLELENLISQIQGVAEVAVVGMPDAKWGERPVALVVKKPDFEGDITLATVQNFLKPFIEKGNINQWYQPDKVLIVPAIPKTSVGKIDKKRIRIDLKEQN